MSTTSVTPGQAKRRKAWAVAAALVLLAVAALALALARGAGGTGDGPDPVSAGASSLDAGDRDGSLAEPAPTTSPSSTGGSTAEPTPAPTAEQEPSEPAGGAPAAVPVTPLGDIAARTGVASEPLEDEGVVVRIAAVTRMTAKGWGPGEISGPAIAVAVEFANRGPAPVDLTFVTVNAHAGPEAVPLSAVATDASNEPVAGSLAPGGAVRGTYVFAVPDDAETAMAVAVYPGPGQAPRVFQGISAT